MKSICACRMAPEVIACDENPDATYDNKVSVWTIDEHDRSSVYSPFQIRLDFIFRKFILNEF